MPKPGDVHRRLQCLIGERAGDELMHPALWDPIGGPTTGRAVNRCEDASIRRALRALALAV
ncbi:MAG: hypothetical protein ACT4QD_06085 [Acidobacteriota bacterium]